MKPKSLAVVATAVSILAGSPAIARADATPANPIVVTRTALSPSSGEVAGPNFLHVVFENKHRVDATRVVFEISGGFYHQRIVDVGTFAPGVAIDHAFLDYSNAPVRKVDVVEVDFVDGTAWTRERNAAPDTRRQATAFLEPR